MEPIKHKNYTLYDKMLMVIILLLLMCSFLTYKSCNMPKPALTDIPSEQESSVVIAQNRYDSLSFITNHQLDSLNSIVANAKKNTTKIITKYKNIHDTIFFTPEDKQFAITKELCPGTGDTLNLKEVNYCLADGKQAEELYKNSILEINALETEIELHQQLVTEGLKNMEAKDSLIGTYREINFSLNNGFKKEKHRKNIWRNVSIGAISTIIAILTISL